MSKTLALLHSIKVIFSVTVGGAYFGMVGMFLAVPVAAVIKLVLEDFVNDDVKYV